MEGRLEMIILHLGLVLDRLALEAPAGLALGQAVSEAYVADVDDALRQIGTGDMGVPRRVKRAAAALRERRQGYGAAIQAGDRETLALAVVNFVFGESKDKDDCADAAAALSDYILHIAATLSALPREAVLAGETAFPRPGGNNQD
jgi:cytochrome b pre-mRNA-processing protein 3